MGFSASIDDFKRMGLVEYPANSGRYIKADTIDKKPEKKKSALKRPKDSLADIKIILKREHIPFKAEYLFHPTRKWRFDLAFPELMLACEYEGVQVVKGEKSRHTTVTGYTGDTIKYNEAVKLGWRVMRYTSITKGSILDDIKFFSTK